MTADLDAFRVAVKLTHYSGKAHVGAFRRGFLARRHPSGSKAKCPYRDTSMQARGFMRAWQAGWEAGGPKSQGAEFEKRREQARQGGTWPNARQVKDCIDCPFFGALGVFGSCEVNGDTRTPFTAEDDAADVPPSWCPLRVAAVRVELSDV